MPPVSEQPPISVSRNNPKVTLRFAAMVNPSLRGFDNENFYFRRA